MKIKKVLVAAFALAATGAAYAALPQVQTVTRIPLPQGQHAGMAALSPDGSYAVIAPLAGNGLDRLDLTDLTVTPISATASPLAVEFTADGGNVLYRESTYDRDHRRFVSLKAYNVADGSVTTIVDSSRRLEGFTTDGDVAVAIEKGRKMTRKLGDTPAQERPALSIDRGRLCVTTGNSTTSIAPLGDACNSYLWPSLSPDGSRILAYGVGTGAFTCNTDGTDVKLLGMFRAPVWMGNDVVIAMDDHDNGVTTTESAIMAIAADGSENARLTEPEVVAVFPSAAAGRVAFTTPEGQLYIITLK